MGRPIDAPDPAEATLAKVRQLHIRVAGFAPQVHLEDIGVLGLATESSGIGGDAVTRSATISRGYTLWRNPNDRADPVNFVELDEAMQRALDGDADQPRPTRVLRAIERMRHPVIYDAVQTHWAALGASPNRAPEDLVEHMNYILNNRYRDDYRTHNDDRTRWAHVIDASHVHEDYAIAIDGQMHMGIVVDTNLHVLGLGVRLDESRTMTAVVPRDYLDMIDLDFTSDLPI